jgi:predicted ATP-dependent serine protease
MFFAHAAVLTPRVPALVIPNNWAGLQARGIGFRRGELSMIAGPPGSGKSSLALALAVRSGVRTLYLSSDTTRETVNLRLIAMLMGMPQSQAEAHMEADPNWASQVLAHVNYISFDDNSAPSREYIEDLMSAYEELHGLPPELVIVDNLADVVMDGQDEYGGLRSLTRDLRQYARESTAAFIALHHTREVAHGGVCPPAWTLHGKTSQVPVLILTVNGMAQPGLMAVSPVKNRWGMPDDGSNPVWLEYLPELMQINDLGNTAFEVVA